MKLKWKREIVFDISDLLEWTDYENNINRRILLLFIIYCCGHEEMKTKNWLLTAKWLVIQTLWTENETKRIEIF